LLQQIFPTIWAEKEGVVAVQPSANFALLVQMITDMAPGGSGPRRDHHSKRADLQKPLHIGAVFVLDRGTEILLQGHNPLHRSERDLLQPASVHAANGIRAGRRQTQR